jgi:hypothetical protein
MLPKSENSRFSHSKVDASVLAVLQIVRVIVCLTRDVDQGSLQSYAVWLN